MRKTKEEDFDPDLYDENRVINRINWYDNRAIINKKNFIVPS